MVPIEFRGDESEALFVSLTAQAAIIAWAFLQQRHLISHVFWNELPFVLVPQLLLVFFPRFALPILILSVALILLSLLRKRKAFRITGSNAIPHLTILRASILLSTVICILAVDFQRWFPDRFAKSLHFGATLMDVGVGAVVYTGGLSAGRSVHRHRGLLHVLKSTVPLLLLGFGRVALIQVSGYHRVVSEYGVHWNFFVTLSLLPLVLYAILKVSSVSFLPLVALVFGGLYQLVLSSTDLQAYLLDDRHARLGLFSQNKEGIFSCIGYACIYLFAAYIGFGVFAHRSRKALAIRLLCCMLISYSGYYTLKHYGIFASRRMANLPYVLWVAAFSTTHHLLLLIFESSFASAAHILAAISHNQLVLFLAANLLTGAVNLLVSPKDAGGAVTIAVMAGYSVGLCLFAVLLHRCGIRLKTKPKE